MNAATISGTTFQLRTGGGALVAATVAYNAATRIATLTPSAALTAATTYTATVTTGVTDVANNALAGNQAWSFTTAAAGDTTPPTVATISPASGSTGVGLSTTVTATFSEAMNSGTISGTTFELRNASNSALVAANVSYNAGTNTATLTPSAALASSTTYAATVTTGAKDVAGNAMAAPRTWSFTTLTVDTTPPTVTAISPNNGAATVSPTANVTATFSEVMNASTISTSTIELTGAGVGTVPAAVTYDATNRVATLNPTSNLVGGVAYTARVRSGAAGVKDAAQNPLAVDRVWTFTIETTPPTVTSTLPANGATGVSRTANITATFSEVVAVATVTAANFELRDPSGTPVAPTSLTLSTNGRTVTLNPEPRLAPLTTYTLVIKGGASGVTDLAGNPLAGDVSRTFTTRQ
jgi:hypothetical protein